MSACGHARFRSSWHRLTNSHTPARASAPRAAQAHEFTLSRSCVLCTDSRIHTLTLVRPLLVLHRLTNSHFHARASASRAAQTHEFTLTLVRPTRIPQLHSFTLSRSRALLAMRRFADSLYHACAPGLSHALTFSRSCAWFPADSRTHVLTLLCLACPPRTHALTFSRSLCLACPPLDSRTHVLTFSRWRVRAAWIQDYSSIQGFTFAVSYVWPSQMHREPAFLVSSHGEPASLFDFVACMFALSVLCCQRDFSYVRLWISLSWQAILCVLCQRTLRVAPRCLWTSSQPMMTEGSRGSWLL